MNTIYLDHSATTPLDPKVLKAMMPYIQGNFGNPSSIHLFGQKNRVAVEAARETVAKILNTSTNEIIFTSGGTESDNLALRGIVKGVQLATRNSQLKPHIIVSAIEHHAVLDTAQDLADNYGISLDILPVNKNGVVDLDSLKDLIKDETVLVSVMLANNEVGTIQPVAELAQMIASLNKDRKNAPRAAEFGKIYLHTDAVQAAGYLDLDVDKLGVDSLSLSAHKFYGPKGVGILYIKTKTPYLSLMTGGGQEHNMRSGTENVAGIVGMAEALSLATHNSQHITRNTIRELRDRLEAGIMKNIPDAEAVGDRNNRLPNIASFIFRGIDAESVLIALDMEGIAASSGSACTVGSIEPSHVLTAMGYPKSDARSLIRFSLGSENTSLEIDTVIQKLPAIVERLRKLGAYK